MLDFGRYDISLVASLQATPKESAVGNFFNNLSTQVWGIRKSTEKDKEEASAIKEKSLFFLVRDSTLS